MNRTILFAVGVIIIDAMGIGLLMPVLPDILAEIQGLDPEALRQTDTANPIAKLAGISLWMTSAYMAMQFVFGPTIGNLSDRFGRRPVLLVSLFILGVDYLILGFAQTIWLLFIGRFLAGIAGATYGTAYAVVADVSSSKDKARNFGFIGAGFGIGFILGPILGATLAGLDSRAPIFAAAALAFINFGYGFFVFRETLDAAKRRPFDWHRANPIGALLHIRKVPHVHRWLAAAFLFGVAFNIYPSLWSFYGRVAAGWDASGIGLSLAVVGVGFAIVQIFLLGPLVKRFGEQRVLIMGIASGFLAFVGLAFAPNGWFIYALTPINALSIVVNPMVQALLSNSVDEKEQGEIQGLSTAIGALASFIAPFIFLYAFAWAVPAEEGAAKFPGMPFLIAAGLMVILLVLALRNPARIEPPSQAPSHTP